MSAAWGAVFLLRLLGPDLDGAQSQCDRAAGSGARPRWTPLQAAVPEPQEQDPLLWAWPGAQEAA